MAVAGTKGDRFKVWHPPPNSGARGKKKRGDPKAAALKTSSLTPQACFTLPPLPAEDQAQPAETQEGQRRRLGNLLNLEAGEPSVAIARFGQDCNLAVGGSHA